MIPLKTVGEESKALPQIQKNPWESLSENPTIEEVKGAVVFLAEKYGKGTDNYSILWNVLKCESGFNRNALGDSGAAYGIAQFHKPTWDSFNKIRGSNLNIYSVKDQLDQFVWAMENGLQSNWTCFKLLKNIK